MKVVKECMERCDKMLKRVQECFSASGAASVCNGKSPLKTASAASPQDFERIKLIGQGDVGKVYLVRLKNSTNYFAMKVLSKQEMIARNKVSPISLSCNGMLTTLSHVAEAMPNRKRNPCNSGLSLHRHALLLFSKP
eukprot:767955-Hanusia_phi.AAC.10